MDNLRAIVELLFRHTSADEILHGSVSYDRVEDENLLMVANAHIPRYSNNEIKNMFYHLSNEFEWHNNRVKGEELGGNGRVVNVFDALFVLGDIMLLEEDGHPMCSYEHLLRWREMILVLDEDLFTTSFLAYHDLFCENKKRDFFWRVVIGHNNRSLNQLMKKGISENHFHLKGSAPMFHLSWINLMNHVNEPAFFKELESYDKRRLNLIPSYNIGIPQSSLTQSYLQALMIRLFLFCKLRKIPFEPWRGWRRDEKDEYHTLIDLLKETDRIHYHLSEIQRSIQLLKAAYHFHSSDYAICERWLEKNPDRNLNEYVTGERWLLYEIFRRIYGKESDFKPYCNLVYMYIVIKSNIRAEIIQTNSNVGFDNFLLYQNRKEAFIEGTDLEPIYVRMAVRDTMLTQSIRSLEARIAPKDTAVGIRNSIRKYDSWINSLQDKEMLSESYFYVVHFIKAEDTEEKGFFSGNCRHAKKRKEVKTQAVAIGTFREQYTEDANRVRGIDSCSPEIGCRPEVFAQAFRYLKNHTVFKRNDIMEEYFRLPGLRTSYHVGEDFLDIIDGLRAIDEAISFLNMRCGDRLGHALALGVNVEEWYASKSGRILINQHDYLDNLVWLYSKIRKFRIEGCEDALRYIQKKFDEYFRLVYLNNIPNGYLDEIAKEAEAYFDQREIPNHYYQAHYNFTINTYYDAWKLRGDNPLNYKHGYFKLRDMNLEAWDWYSVNKDFPDNYIVRYNPEAACLYHLYHYSSAIRKEGNKTIEVKISPSLIAAADKVQKKMQEMVCDKGIAIETNPSSNYLIGSFKRYDKHPILEWYNYGLITDSSKIQNCPQIRVSINTDDQGVFATCLENEYALLALALEKAKDHQGKPMYNRTLIYNWLDQIREMGLSMSFI